MATPKRGEQPRTILVATATIFAAILAIVLGTRTLVYSSAGTVDHSSFCAERFGLKYLENLSNQSAEYCTPESPAALTCFHSQTTKDSRTDSLCFGRSARFNAGTRKFSLGCDERRLSKSKASSLVPQLDQFTEYWYDTGPRAILSERIVLDASIEVKQPTKKFTILVKREGSHNPWHSLMEILSMTMTLDVLRMAIEPATNAPLFSQSDEENTQVMILDDHEDGPYFDLWSMFARRPIVRVNHTTTDTTENIIIPLAGASNPFWQGDWVIHYCPRSELLRTFTNRVFNFYHLDAAEPRTDDIVLTFIDRKDKRRLVNHVPYLEALEASTPPHVKIQTVDFAALSFADQIRVVRDTDVLVGTHGAGLTQGMFLREESVMVEILPQGLRYKGFRNLADMLGHSYFSAQGWIPGVSESGEVVKLDLQAEAAKKAKAIMEAELAKIAGAGKKVENAKSAGIGESVTIGESPDNLVPIQQERTRSWQGDDIFLEKERFLDLMDIAIKAVHDKGLQSSDVE